MKILRQLQLFRKLNKRLNTGMEIGEFYTFPRDKQDIIVHCSLSLRCFSTIVWVSGRIFGIEKNTAAGDLIGCLHLVKKVSVVTTIRHFHCFLQQQCEEWFNILVPTYPCGLGSSPLKRDGSQKTVIVTDCHCHQVSLL